MKNFIKKLISRISSLSSLGVLGAVLIALGCIALIFSSHVSRLNVVYFGIFLIALGIFEGIHARTIRPWRNFFLHFFMSLLYFVGGILIAIDPLNDEALVTLLHAFFFICCGILRLIFSYEKELSHPRWLFLNGIITLSIGCFIAFAWPESSLWVLATVVALDSIMTGWTWMMISHEHTNTEEPHALFFI